MLVLSRKDLESIIIGDKIRIQVVSIRGDKVRIGISAAPSVEIHRKEIWEAKTGREWHDAAEIKA